MIEIMKVLLVDDSPVNQLVTSALLSEIGVEHTCADNGLIALEVLKNDDDHSYDLVLMDCHMPDLNGFKATKLIRRGYAGAEHKLTPIVALTGSSDDEDKIMCLEAGMNGYLTKPVSVADLDTTINSLAN